MKSKRNESGYWDATQLPRRPQNSYFGSRRPPEPPIEPPDGYIDSIYEDDEDEEREEFEDDAKR